MSNQLIKEDLPGFPDQTEKEGTTVPSGSTVSGKITARSLMMTNLPYRIRLSLSNEGEGVYTYDDGIITYFNSTPNLGSFNYTILADMYEIRYPDWIVCELTVY